MSGSHDRELSQEMESLISRQFDGELSREEHRRLKEWINSNPENAKVFVEFAILHDRMLATNSQSIGTGDDFAVETPQTSFNPTRRQKRTRWAIGVVSSLAALLLISFFIFQVFQGTPALAAETQLERLIEIGRESSDRTYLITSLDLRGKKRNRERNRSGRRNQSNRRGDKPQAPVDGALLHVRGENSYVLVRRFANGDEFITGSDGDTSWSVPPQGRVRVSDDVERFRGGMPGNQHAIPFINLHGDLQQIQDAYNIQWLDTTSGTLELGKGHSCLVATKKSAQHRGPKYIEIWFNSKTGVIVEMLLDKLPQARGGPETVLLKLVDQSELPEGFFHHTSHHDLSRKIKFQDE